MVMMVVAMVRMGLRTAYGDDDHDDNDDNDDGENGVEDRLW